MCPDERIRLPAGKPKPVRRGQFMHRRTHPLLPNLRWRLSWYLKRTRVSHPPYFVNIEPTNICNLRCTICSMDDSRENGYMDPGLFRRIADDAAAAGVIAVRLFLGGEPLMHPDIPDFVRYAESKGLVTNIHTNATMLDGRMSEALLDAGLSMLTFSFDGETSEEYEKIRVGGKFDEVLRNIIAFLEMKRMRNSMSPETTLQIIRPVTTADDANGQSGRSLAGVSEGFRKRFDGLPLDHLLVIPPHNWAGEMTGIGEEPPGKVYFPCQLPWQSLSAAWDGSVVACCGDLNGRMVLGDFRRETIADVWNGEALISMRKQQLRSDTPKCSLCSSCTSPWREHHPLIQDLKEFIGRKRR
jgi:hypothetical protein